MLVTERPPGDALLWRSYNAHRGHQGSGPGRRKDRSDSVPPLLLVNLEHPRAGTGLAVSLLLREDGRGRAPLRLQHHREDYIKGSIVFETPAGKKPRVL